MQVPFTVLTVHCFSAVPSVTMHHRLPLPHEVEFMGMWMEGVGSWNGMLMEEAKEHWHPDYQANHAQFLQHWDFLLKMTPVAEMQVLKVTLPPGTQQKQTGLPTAALGFAQWPGRSCNIFWLLLLGPCLPHCI